MSAAGNKRMTSIQPHVLAKCCGTPEFVNPFVTRYFDGSADARTEIAGSIDPQPGRLVIGAAAVQNSELFVKTSNFLSMHKASRP